MERITSSIHLRVLWLLPWLALAIAPRACATNVVSYGFMCPTCGTTFEGALVVSETVFGRRLDMKPLGSSATPHPLPVCPKDHFTFYHCAFADAPISRSGVEDPTDRRGFLRDECMFTEAQIALLRVHVQTEGYRALVGESNPYLLLGSVQEFLGATAQEIAFTYLQASWLAEGEPAAWERCLGLSLAWTGRALAAEPRSPDAASQRVLRVELLRLLGRFREAAQEASGLLSGSGDLSSDLHRIVVYERRLIRSRDRQPHQIPRRKD